MIGQPYDKLDTTLALLDILTPFQSIAGHLKTQRALAA